MLNYGAGSWGEKRWPVSHQKVFSSSETNATLEQPGVDKNQERNEKKKKGK